LLLRVEDIMAKTVIHLFNDNDAALTAGSHVAERVRQVAAERNVELEVFLFGPAQAALTAPSEAPARLAFKAQIAELAKAGVRVGACINAANSAGTANELQSRGIALEFARDAFVRFGLEAAAVLTF
jgi:hypothetical protein